jgi:hypothetical protein
LPRGLGRCVSLGDSGPELRPWAPSTSGHPFPAPEPSKQQARGSSSRSGAECQAITALYSLCRVQMVLLCCRRNAPYAAMLCSMRPVASVRARSMNVSRASNSRTRDCEQSARTLSLCSKQILEIC